MNVRWRVELTQDERKLLKARTSRGKYGARKMKRALILLAADQGKTDEEVASAVSAGRSTVYRTRRRFVEGGLDHAINEQSRPGGARKLNGKQEATLVALACSKPPPGRCRWTLVLLAEHLVCLVDDLASISVDTVRRRLAENELKPWQKRMWCIPKVDTEFVARMEDVIELYAQTHDPARPVVCFDETPVQLIGETRVPIPPEPGKPERCDYEYKRNGTANLFVSVAPKAGWRHVEVTERKTKLDFAACMRDLVDVHFPDADVVRVVLDNLSTHRPAALYEAFAPAEARRILRRLELHYTPKHGSWLNMAEIEIGVVNRQCLDRRIPDKETLAAEVAAWEHDRNEAGATIDWMFSLDDARRKLGRAYPEPVHQPVCWPTRPARSVSTTETRQRSSLTGR